MLVPAAVTGEVRDDGELPTGAPYWLRVFQYLLVLTIFAASPDRSFVASGRHARSAPVCLRSTSGAPNVRRIAFGVGAIITWLCLILVAVGGWRKFVSAATAPHFRSSDTPQHL